MSLATYSFLYYLVVSSIKLEQYMKMQCPCVLRLHLGVTSWDLLDQRKDLAGTYGCNGSLK